MQPLTGKQIRHLRALGHHLQPVVLIGKEELSSRLLGSVEEALASHELIKIKLQEGCLTDRREVASQLAQACNAQQVQVLGRTILLYRPSDKNRIELPAAGRQR
ncbi:ribosome assembly RNA-binding protein YhbY [Desulfuromonas thiophila]|uniref:RNA-binding protein n=1 Tax=Desulfuromonas thiophila TaxID=57664 RepID=A0A1G7AHS3_9BACT|nr:ribosome assembly RNA-binding protein YhbY [Desulfuromonas thiophila]SDE14312.1 RNA-binding protein [Desulfuromonas thiophila]